MLMEKAATRIGMHDSLPRYSIKGVGRSCAIHGAWRWQSQSQCGWFDFHRRNGLVLMRRMKIKRVMMIRGCELVATDIHAADNPIAFLDAIRICSVNFPRYL